MEALRWIDKGKSPLLGWIMDSTGDFKVDADGNRYLLAAMDPFGKWVESRKVPSLQSWRTAKFLFNIIARHGKPHFVRTDNGPEYAGTFS